MKGSRARGWLLTMLAFGGCLILSSPAYAESEPVWEARTMAWVYSAKGRVRDGELGLDPDSFFYGNDLGVEDPDLALDVRVDLTWDVHRFWLQGWTLATDGSGTVEDRSLWAGGQVIPVGTTIDTELRMTHYELGYSYRFALVEDVLYLDVGAHLQYVSWDLHMEPAGLSENDMSLHAWHPAPIVDLIWKCNEASELHLVLGGMYVPWTDGDVEVNDPQLYELWYRTGKDRLTFSAGFRLYHKHLERDVGDDDEDITHLRLRGIVFAFAYTF
jgi:hypothetical protein